MHIVLNKFILIGILCLATIAVAKRPPLINKERKPKRVIKMVQVEPAVPALQVPHPIDSYKYIVVGEVDGVVLHPSAVPVYRINQYDSDPIEVGTLPLGSDFVPEKIKTKYGRNFFGTVVQPDASNPFKRIVWIDGRFLRADVKK